MKKPISIAILLCAGLTLAGCATKDPASLAQNDPWEPTNRAVFDFDIKLDNAVAKPAAVFYRSAVPEPAREGVHNALDNLNAPVVFVNDVLQGEGENAGNTLGRFLVNSTLGLGGLIDVGTKIGIPGHTTDFGITLGKAGAAEGSYLVLPLAGPKPPRDLVGTGVDIAFDPLTYISWHGSTYYLIGRALLGFLDDRSANIESVESIQRSSIDFYATTRNLYRQSRAAQINGGKSDLSDLPNL